MTRHHRTRPIKPTPPIGSRRCFASTGGRSIGTSALVPNVFDADEVFQDTSITLWKKFDQYRPDLDFRAWACRIAYYKVLKLRDRQTRSPAIQSAIPRFDE